MTSLEPSVVTIPLFRTDIYTATTRTVSTLTTLASTVTTPSTTPATTKSTGIPPLPTAFDSTLATGQSHTPAIALVALLAVLVGALTLLIALCYYIFLCFRGKCPNCPRYEAELSKHKDCSRKYDTRDLDKGPSPFDQQAQQYRIRTHAESLAWLQGHAPAPLLSRADSVWPSEVTLVARKLGEREDV